jgi:transglutaminase-like putative cysteine protease
MLFAIHHVTRLDYSQAISESVMEVRSMPRTDERQVLRHFELSVTPNARANCHTDWLENAVHQFSVLGAHDFVEVSAHSVVETRSVHWDLDGLRAPVPGLIRDHRSWDFLQHHDPVLHDPALPALAQRLGLDEDCRVGEALELVMTRTRDVISYRKGVTNSSSTVRDILRAGAGVCQDFTHLALALLRRFGVPCRYVSGYLFGGEEEQLETHAWLDAFVPGFGWVGIDPTHGTLLSENHVTVAVGRSYSDVPPNRGVYRGKAEEHIQVNVSMTQLEERARLTPYSKAVERPRQAPKAVVESAPMAFRTGLEQQRVHPETRGLIVQQQRQQQQ